MSYFSLLFIHREIKKIGCLCALMYFFFSPCSLFAKTIIIKNKINITQPTSYKNVTIVLDGGSFVVSKEASLTIENSIIYMTISPENPHGIELLSGALFIKNNKFNVIAKNIKQDLINMQPYQVMHITQGKVKIVQNVFTVDEPYSVGFLVTDRLPMTGMLVSDNKIYQFHGGVILTNVNNANIINNVFSRVSISNLLIKNGEKDTISKNSFLFSGNGTVGDSIDLINTNHIIISKNHIYSGFCYSILLISSKDILIDQNSVTGGITYAVHIIANMSRADRYNGYLASFLVNNHSVNQSYANQRISLTNNYFAQNRYALSVVNVDGLTVKNNIMIQRFSDPEKRRFWTDNDVLLQDAIHIIWQQNYYKEAFSQEIKGKNDYSMRFFVFPAQGGVLF